MFAILLGLSHAGEPPVQTPEVEQQVQVLIETVEARQDALLAINVDGLMALIEQMEDQQSPSVAEPSAETTPDSSAVGPVEDTDISPLLVPVR